MCGIIAVVRRPTDREVPEPALLRGYLDAARAALAGAGRGAPTELTAAVSAAASDMAALDELLRGSAGLRALLFHPELADEIAAAASEIETGIGDLEGWADSDAFLATG